VDRTKKAETIKALRERFEKALAVVVFDYRGMTVEEVNGLRREFRKNAVDYRVLKNTLGRIALKGTAFEGVSKFLKETTAVALALGDPTQPARVAVGFIKGNEKLKIRAGALPGSVLGPAEVKALASLPSKDELRAGVLSLFQTPQRNMLYVLSGAQRGLLNVISAHGREMEKGAAA
jgi:large subunit ribosomal protein L10